MDKFEPFHVIDDITYKTIGDAKLQATALVPKDAPSGFRPVIVRYHGGFWIGGERKFQGWMPQW